MSLCDGCILWGRCEGCGEVDGRFVEEIYEEPDFSFAEDEEDERFEYGWYM